MARGRTEDFFVEFGSDAGAFSRKLSSDLEGAVEAVERLDQALDMLDRRVAKRTGAGGGQGSSMFASLASTVQEISKLPGSFRTIASDLGGVVDAMQTAIRKLNNADFTTPRGGNIAAVGADVTPVATPARKQARKRAAKRIEAAAVEEQRAVDEQVLVAETSAATAKKVAKAAKKQAAAVERSADVAEQAARETEEASRRTQTAAKRRAPLSGRRLATSSGEVIIERSKEELEQFFANSAERFQALLGKMGSSMKIEDPSRDFDRAVNEVLRLQSGLTEIIEDVADAAKAATNKAKAAQRNTTVPQVTVTPVPAAAPPARPQSQAPRTAAPVVQDATSQQKLDTQRIKAAMGMDRESVRAMPRADIQALAKALGVGAGGNQNQIAKRVNDQLDAARSLATAATEQATREAVQQAVATQSATEATKDNEQAQERAAVAAQGLAVAEESAERALEDLAQRVRRIRTPPNALDAARGRATAARNEIARLKEGLETGTLGSRQDPQSFASRIARQEEIRDQAQQIVNEGRLSQLMEQRGEYQKSLAQQIAIKQATSKGFGTKDVQPGLKLVGAEGIAEILGARALPVTEGTNNPATAAKRVIERLRGSIAETLESDADKIAASRALDRLASDKSLQALTRSTRGFTLPDVGGETAEMARQLMRDTMGARPGAGLTRGLGDPVRQILTDALPLISEVAAGGGGREVEEARELIRRIADKRAGAVIPDNVRDIATLGSARMQQGRRTVETRSGYDLDAVAGSNLLRILVDELRESPRRQFGAGRFDESITSAERQLTELLDRRSSLPLGTQDEGLERQILGLNDNIQLLRAMQSRALSLGGGSDAPIVDLIRETLRQMRTTSTAVYPQGIASSVAPGRLTGGVIEGQTGSVTRLPMNSAQIRQPQFVNLTPEEARDPQAVWGMYQRAVDTIAGAKESASNAARSVALDLLRADPSFSPFTPSGFGLARPKLAKGVREDEDERLNRMEALRSTRPIVENIAAIDRYTVELARGIDEQSEKLRGTSGAEADGIRQIIAEMRSSLREVFGGTDPDAVIAGAREREAVRAVQQARQEMREENARTGVDSLRKSFNDMAYAAGQGQSSRSLQNVGSTSREAQTGATLFGSDGRAVPARQLTMDEFENRIPNATPAQRALYDELTNLRRGVPNKRNPRRRSGGIEGSLRAIGRAGQQLTLAEEALAADPTNVAAQAKVAELRDAKAKADRKYQDAIDQYIEGFDRLFGASGERELLSPQEVAERNRIAKEERQAYLDLAVTPDTSDRDRDIQERARAQQEKERLLEDLRRQGLTDASSRVTTDAAGADRGPVRDLEDLLSRDENIRKRFEDADRRAAQAARGAAGALIPETEQAALATLIGRSETGPTAEAVRAAKENVEALKEQNRVDQERLETSRQASRVAGESLAALQAQRDVLAAQTARKAGAGRVNEDTRMQEIYALDAALGLVDPQLRTGSTDADGNVIAGGIPRATDPREIRRLQARREYLMRPTIQDKNARLKDLDERIAAATNPQVEADNTAAEIAARMAARERQMVAEQKVIDAPKFALTTDQYREAERAARYQRSAAVKEAAEAQRSLPLRPIFEASGGTVNQLADAVEQALGTAATVAQDASARAKRVIADATEDAIEDGVRQGVAAANAGINKELPTGMSEAQIVSAAKQAAERSGQSIQALEAAERLSQDLAARQSGNTEQQLKDRTRSTLRNRLQRFLGESTGDLNDSGYASLIDRARGEARGIQGGLDPSLVALGDSISKQLVAGGGGGGPIDVRVVSFGAAAVSTLSSLVGRRARQDGTEGADNDPNRIAPTRSRRTPRKAEQPGPELSDVRQVSVRELYEAALNTSQGNLLAAQAEPELTADKLRQIQAGTVDPVVREASGEIRDGFHRIAAAAAAGIETLPVRDVVREVGENQPRVRRTAADRTAQDAQRAAEREQEYRRELEVERANLPGNIGALLGEGNGFEAARRATAEGYKLAEAMSLVKRQLGLSREEATALKTQVQAANAADRAAGRKAPRTAEQIAQEEADVAQAKAEREERVRLARAAELSTLPAGVQAAIRNKDANLAAQTLITDEKKTPGKAAETVARQLGMDAQGLAQLRAELTAWFSAQNKAKREQKEFDEATRRANEALLAEQQRLGRVSKFMDTFTADTQQAINALQALMSTQRQLQAANLPVPQSLRDDIETARIDVAGRVNEEQRSQRYVDTLGRTQSVIPPSVQQIRLKDVLNTTGPETNRIGREGAAMYTRSFQDGIMSQRSGLEAALFGNGGFFGRMFATGGAFIIREFAGNFVFGLSNVIQESFRQALASEMEFVRVSNGLEALNESPEAIMGMRSELSNISTDLGVPLQEVYESASQLIGVFDNAKDIEIGARAAKELEIISNGALSAKEGVQSLAAATEAFPGEFNGARGMQQLVDLATRIQDLTGVNIEDQLEGLATLGPQAQALGLDPTAGMLMAGLAAKRTGQTGDAAAEQVSRIFASLGSGRGQDALINAGISPELIQNQEFGDIYKQLLEGLANNTINQAQVAELVQAVGPRQARSFQALLQNPQQTLDAFAGAADSAGAGMERVEKITATLKKRLDSMRQSFINLIENLVKMGALTSFEIILGGVSKLLDGVNKLLELLIGLQDRNPFVDFFTKATFAAVGFMAIMKAIGIGATAFRSRVAELGLPPNPAVQAAGAARTYGVQGAGPGGIPLSPYYFAQQGQHGAGLAPGAARVQQGALAGGAGGIRAGISSGIGAFQAGRFGTNLALGSAGTLTRFLSSMGVASTRMDRYSVALQRLQANTVLAANASRRSALIQGAVSGLLSTALIALPFFISAINQRRETEKSNRELGERLFGAPAENEGDRRRKEVNEHTRSVVEAETSWGESMLRTWGSKERALGGFVNTPNNLWNVAQGVGSWVTGNGFNLGDSQNGLSRRLHDIADADENAAGEGAFAGAAEMRDSMIAKIDQAGGAQEALTEALAEIDAKGRELLDNSDLDPMDYAYLVEELENLKRGVADRAKNLRENAMGLIDADKLTSDQLSSVGQILTQAMTLSPATRAKYGSSIYKGLLAEGKIREDSAIGEAQRILLGAPKFETDWDKLALGPQMRRIPGSTPGSGEPGGIRDAEGYPMAPTSLDDIINWPTAAEIKENPEAYVDRGLVKRIDTSDMTLRERQEMARTALEEQIEQLEASLATATPEDREQVQADLTAAIQMYDQISTDLLQGAINRARSLADLAIAMNDNEGGISALGDVTKALEANLKNLEKDSPEFAQAQLEIAQNKRRIAELRDETSINGGEGFNDLMVRAARTRDPIAKAKIDLQIAEQRLKTAKSTDGFSASDIRDLEAQVIAAEMAAADLASAVAASASALAIAVANAAGDNVGSARLALDEANRLLEQAIADKAGEAAVNQARANAVSAQAAYRDAVINETMSDLDFGYEMGTLTANAYIEGLNGLLKRSDLTKQQRQDIERKIKGLQDELKQSLTGSGFNIPTDIQMPTAYQVRRSLGMDQAGGGTRTTVTTSTVNNNQQVTVTNAVPNAAVAQQIASQVVEMINGQNSQGARAATSTPRLVAPNG